MGKDRRWQAGALLAAALAVWAAGQAGVTVRLGAHPFWAREVPLMGLVLAVPIALVGFWRPGLAGSLALVCLIAGAVSARLGKAAFAASYAENALAGQFWFFGWIVLSGGAVALIAVGLARLRPRA